MIGKVQVTSSDVSNSIQAVVLPISELGDGSDGSVVFDGIATILGMVPSSQQYTLVRDIYVDAMTVNSGVRIKTNGFRIFGRGNLVNRGTIHCNGANASGTTAGVGITNSGTFSISTGGGGNGRTTAGVGNAGASSGGNCITGSAGGNGGNGAINLGGTGNASSAAAATAGSIRNIGFFNQARLLGSVLPNGSGGGGGGGAAVGQGSVASGAGGAGGGGVGIVCYSLDNAGGIISADGGAGSNGTGDIGAEAGGGGGGAGGWVFIAAGVVVAEGTIRANGGAAGTGFGIGGTSGQSGTAGVVVTLFPS